MKKFLTMAAAAIMAVCLFALSACGGASSTLSSFVSAVKKADFETAAEYVVGQPSLSNPSKGDGDLYEYMWDQTAGSFKYSVEETSTNDDETATTIKISYSCYSYAVLVAKYVTQSAANLITGSEITKSDIKEWINDMDKIESTTSVIVVESDGEWLLEAASATALLAIICS